MATAHIIQHIAFEGIGHFGPALIEAGYEIDIHMGARSLPEDISPEDCLIILGGPIVL